MKISMMGTGSPIVEDKPSGVIPADRRLGKEETKRLNDQDELELIQYQNRLVQIEEQIKQDKEATINPVRDSCVLYDELI